MDRLYGCEGVGLGRGLVGPVPLDAGEAERDADRELIDRLTLERRTLNEQRRSLDRRRDQTRLLARTAVPTG